MGRIALLVNPTSGGGRGGPSGAAVAEQLRTSGVEVTDVSGASADEARHNAQTVLDQGVDALVVVGGDGVVHLGVNLVAGTSTPLGIVPAGTGNDIARALGLSIDDVAAAGSTVLSAVQSGTTRTIDAARHLPDEGTVGAGWFAGVLGAGFDAKVNERANGWRWPKGPRKYDLAIARELPVFKPLPYVLELDGQVVTANAMLVAVGNGPSYGGGMLVCPDAELDDGLLDVMIVDKISKIEFLKVFPKVYTGAHKDHPAVSIHRARTVRLSTPGIVAYADGERYAALPLTCEVVPGALHVLS
ncbi:MAG: YegS/Rv2252/BmrU family lipid kinase [Actinomycetales bacterium]